MQKHEGGGGGGEARKRKKKRENTIFTSKVRLKSK